MKLLIASDHAGFELKEFLKQELSKYIEIQIQDFGALQYNESDNYPDFIIPVAQTISEHWKTENNCDTFAIIIGGSGQGEAMCANRYDKVRATVFYGGDFELLKLSREHNNANILSLGARFLSKEEALKACNYWLSFKDLNILEKHKKRIAMF
jgi:ribose 5-phosphate isomerase B